jgi:FkbM family methyltransferase
MLILPKRFVFVDVGAYDGSISRQYHQFLNGDAERFHLIEPNPINYINLQETMKGFNLYKLAICDHNGLEALYFNPEHKNASSLYREMAEGKGGDVKEAVVECCTMDAFMERAEIDYISFLKVNCEGGEFGLFGAPTLDFLDVTTYILISWHGKRDVFNDKTATDKKIAYNHVLMKSGFRFLDGVKPEAIGQQGGRSHEMQFWKKD